MTSGGARLRTSAPDPDALRRERDGHTWVTLPAEGRSGKAPAWPLSDASKRELALWRSVWRKPQAVMWEREQLATEVALYVRRLAEAEAPGSPVSVGTLVRQYADALGLTIPGMRSWRWRISDDVPVAAPRASRPAATSSGLRLKVVAPRDDDD